MHRRHRPTRSRKQEDSGVASARAVQIAARPSQAFGGEIPIEVNSAVLSATVVVFLENSVASLSGWVDHRLDGPRACAGRSPTNGSSLDKQFGAVTRSDSSFGLALLRRRKGWRLMLALLDSG
jgi:hypothetical protein